MKSSITGGKEIAAAFRNMRPAIARPLNEASRAALRQMLSTAKGLAPVRTGGLKKSLVVKRADSPSDAPVHEVGPARSSRAVRYAHLVEFGRAANANGKGGLAGPRFLSRAFDENSKQAIQIFGVEIGAALERLATRLASKAKK